MKRSTSSSSGRYFSRHMPSLYQRLNDKVEGAIEDAVDFVRHDVLQLSDAVEAADVEKPTPLDCYYTPEGGWPLAPASAGEDWKPPTHIMQLHQHQQKNVLGELQLEVLRPKTCRAHRSLLVVSAFCGAFA